MKKFLTLFLIYLFSLPAFAGTTTINPITCGTPISQDKILYYDSVSHTGTCLNVGSGLSVTGGALTSTGGSGGGTWGSITGTLSDQTDLQSALNLKLNTATAASTYTPLTRTISTTAPLTGGGDLSSNRTIAIPAATNSVDGYLTAADHTIYSAKVGGSGSIGSIAKWATSASLTNATAGTDYANLTFKTISTPAGTSPVADTAADTLTFSSTEGTATITGNSTTDAVNFHVAGALVHPTTGSTFEYANRPLSMIGNWNTGYGVDAGKDLTIGIYNVAIANNALRKATDPTGVIAIGQDAAASVVAGASNSVVIGTSNASLATTLSTSTLIGTRLATSTSGVSSVIAVGDLIYQNITSAALNNLGVGFNLFNAIASDSSNYGIGKDIGDAATSISSTFSFGEGLFRNASGVSGAYAFGQNQFNNLAFANNLYGIGTSNLTGNGAGAFDSFLIGSGIANNGAAFLDGNVLIGLSIAGNNSDPYLSSDIIIGKNAGLNGTSLVNEVYIGEGAGGNSIDGTGNTCIAAGSCYGVVHGQSNINIGYQSGYIYDGFSNTATGFGSMYSWNGSYNVFSGVSAGNVGAGDSIVGIGNSAFGTVGTVTRAMALGAFAGAASSTDVTDVIILGYEAEASSTSATNEMVVGSASSPILNYYLGWGGLPSTAPAGSDIYIQPTTSTNGTIGANLHLVGGADNNSGTSGYVYIDGTDAFLPPIGTTAQRPAAPIKGMIRFNSTTGKHEGYDGSNWKDFY